MPVLHESDRAAVPRARARRIHIIGGPGSGKSTLALKLGTVLNLSVYDLDLIAFEGKEFGERPLEQRLADVRQIAARTEWITEGIFIGWIDELLERAEVILWLDALPWHRAAARIVNRFVRLGYQEARTRRGLEKFFRFRDYRRHLGQLGAVMFTSRSYYTGLSEFDTADIRRVTHAATAAALERYSSKVIQCRSAEAVQQFMASATLTRTSALSWIASTGRK